MRTASHLLQILALDALLAAQVHGAIAMAGVRQALRTIGGQPSQIFCQSGKPVAPDLARIASERPVPGPCPA